jgi:predicted DNA-binding mobile mystery protein A
MGKAHTGVLSLESNELSGAITLQSLESAAKALNCRLIYALVPEDSLDAVVETRARELALKMFYEVSQSMKLENQEVTDSQDREKQIGKLTQEFITDIKRLWD